MKYFITFSFVIFSVTANQNCPGNYFPEFICGKDGLLKQNEETLEKLKVCSNPDFFGGPNGKPAGCAIYCVNNALGVLDKDGLVTIDIYNLWIESVFPKVHQEMAKALYLDCFNKHGDGFKIDKKMDTNCEHAGDFNKCAGNLISKLTCNSTESTKTQTQRLIKVY